MKKCLEPPLMEIKYLLMMHNYTKMQIIQFSLFCQDDIISYEFNFQE